MPTMGRRPTKNFNCPPHFRVRDRVGVAYFFYDLGGKPRKELPLGTDYATAIRKWADLEQDAKHITPSLLTFKVVSDRYARDVLPMKAARTQKDNLVELDNLLKFFNNPPAPFGSIQPIHIRQFMDWRTDKGKHSTTRANREKALFSHIWNMAREWGLTDLSNPCAGIKGFTEHGRTVYTEDDVLDAVYECGDRALKDALDLAYLCIQRPADTIKMSETDIRDGVLEVVQNKTGARIRINLVGELDQVIKRIMKLKKTFKVRSLALVCKDNGAAMTYGALRNGFDRARIEAIKRYPKLEKEIKEFQFRDLRAKGGTDKAEKAGNVRAAQKLLGHSTEKTTEIYIRKIRGETVDPTK